MKLVTAILAVAAIAFSGSGFAADASAPKTHSTKHHKASIPANQKMTASQPQDQKPEPEPKK